MTENKRYNIKPSKIIEDGFCIQDDEREHSFPTVDDKSHLIMYEKALNEQDERIKQLQIDIMGQSEEIEILSDENERLKQIREEQTETILKQKRKIRELEGMGDVDD